MKPPEDYFERDEDGIRLKGHRIWLEHLLTLYLAGMTPEQIITEYPTVTLAEAQAAIAYYHTHQAEVEAYLEQQRAEAEAREQSDDTQPSPRATRLHALLEERGHGRNGRSGAATA